MEKKNRVLNISFLSDKFLLVEKKQSRRQYFALYTVLFIAMIFLIYFWNFILGKALIWEPDGWEQHLNALTYFSQHVRAAIKSLILEGRIVFPEWDFGFGEGNDILHSLHFYTIGDPFSLPAIFVPTRFAWVYYEFSAFLRLYFAGIVFSYLCFYMRKNVGRIAVLAGAFSYTFCTWGIFNANRHPFFLNPMIYFPLIIVGIEKIIKNEKPYLFIVAVFFSATSNFYFFYMIVLLTVIYCLVRAFVLFKKDFKQIIGLALRIGAFAVFAVMMAAVIILPVCVAFLSDARMDSAISFKFIYPFSHYSMLLNVLFSAKSSYWLCMGFTCSAILATVLFVGSKDGVRESRLTLKILLLMCAIVVIIPAFGQIFNGFSYLNNRWSFALALLCSYISVLMWPQLMKANRKDMLKLMLFLAACLCICVVGSISRSVAAFAEISVAFLFIAVILVFGNGTDKKANKKVQVAALAVVLIGVICLAYFKNAPSADNYISEDTSVKNIAEKRVNTEAKVIKRLAEEDGKIFYRYSGQGLNKNAGTLKGISSTSYYWTNSNPALSEYIKELELTETRFHVRQGYDDRSALLALTSVNYYAKRFSDNKTATPFGYSEVGTIDVNGSLTKKAKEALMSNLGIEELTKAQSNALENRVASKFTFYRNDNSLPLGYSYEKIIGNNTWSKLSAVEKQEAMLQAVYIDGYTGKQDGLNLKTTKLEYDIACDKGVRLENGKIIVTKANTGISISFNGIKNSETYVVLHGLDYEGLSEYDLYFGTDSYKPEMPYSKTTWELLSKAQKEKILRKKLYWTKPERSAINFKTSSGTEKSFYYNTEEYSWYADIHDYSVNLGYSETPIESVKINFSGVGVYTYDSLEIESQPFDDYKKQVDKLTEDSLTNLNLKTDLIEGDISLDREKVLCLSIPYSAGWKAYVDGEQAKIYKANIKNMALILEPGKHKIRLEYRTPYLRCGIIISSISIVLFIVIALIDFIKTRKIKKFNKNNLYDSPCQ